MHQKATQTLQTAVLTKIGRNVLNLQKMEGMIKHLVAISQVEGPIDELSERFENAKEALSKRSMGLVAGELFKTLLGGSSDQQAAASNENWAAFSFQIDLEPNSREAFEYALRSLIEERNRLIHSMFIRFDLKSQDQCEAMLNALDRQHELIRPQYERLQALLAHLASTGRFAHEQMAKYIEGLGDDA